MHRTLLSAHLWARLALSFVLLINVVACTMGKQPTANNPALPEMGRVSQTNEPVTITFGGYEWERQLYTPLMDVFHQQHPEITVQFTPLPEYSDQSANLYRHYYRLLASTADTSLVSGLGAEASSYFRDLTPILETNPDLNTADFWPVASDACQDAAGRILGLPVSLDLRGVFYDPQVFDDAGLQHPTSGWTWDDFRHAVAALSANGRYAYAEHYGTILSPLIAASVAENQGEIDPKTIQPAIQWYLDLVTAKAIRPAAGEDQQAPDDWDILFQSENPPAMWGGSLGDNTPGAGFNAEMAYQKYGFAPYPVAVNGSDKHTTPVRVSCLTISNGSQHLQAAGVWLEFLSQHWLVMDQASSQAIASIPGRISVADNVGYWEKLPAELSMSLRYILEQGGYDNALSGDAEWIVSDALARVVAGKVDFATALQEAQAQWASHPSSSAGSITMATPQPTLSADVTTINFLYEPFNEKDHQALKSLVEAYNKAHSDVAINFSKEFSAPTDSNYLNAVSDAFDCFTYYPEDWNNISPDTILSLNPFLESESESFLQDFEPVLVDAFRYEGTQYALPAYSQPTVMVYNGDLLAKRGLKPPSVDWTFDDYVDLASQAASTDDADRSYGMFISPYDRKFFDGMGVDWGDLSADPFSPPKFDSPEFASGLARIAALNKAGVLLLDRQEDYDALYQAMQSGQVAFWQTQLGQWGGWYYPINEMPPYQIGVVPMPVVKDPTVSNTWSLKLGFFISGKTDSPQACWDWIKFLSEQPFLSSSVPARISVATSPTWETMIGQENANIYRLATARVESTNPSYLVFIESPFQIWQAQAVSAALDGSDYQSLLPVIQSKVENYLVCIGATDYAKLPYDELNLAIQKCAAQADPGGNWGP